MGLAVTSVPAASRITVGLRPACIAVGNCDTAMARACARNRSRTRAHALARRRARTRGHARAHTPAHPLHSEWLQASSEPCARERARTRTPARAHRPSDAPLHDDRPWVAHGPMGVGGMGDSGAVFMGGAALVRPFQKGFRMIHSESLSEWSHEQTESLL